VYSRLEEKRAAFQKRVKEQSTLLSICFLDAGAHVVEHLFVKANKMREIIDELPADVDALLARMEKKYDDRGMDEDSSGKKKGRERTVQGALAELQL
jgi:hypothetical protein